MEMKREVGDGKLKLGKRVEYEIDERYTTDSRWLSSGDKKKMRKDWEKEGGSSVDDSQANKKNEGRMYA